MKFWPNKDAQNVDLHLVKLDKFEFFSISKGLFRFEELYVCAHEKSASSCKYKCYLCDIVVKSSAKIHQTFTKHSVEIQDFLTTSILREINFEVSESSTYIHILISHEIREKGKSLNFHILLHTFTIS